MQTDFTIDYRATEALESRRALNRALYGGPRWIAWVAIVLPAALFVAFAIHAWVTLWLGDMTASAIVAAGIALVVYIRLIAPLIGRRQFRRLSGVRSQEGRKVSYAFGDEGYRIVTEYFEGFQKWAGVDRILDDGKRVLIVLGPQAHFLPERAFASDEARQAFVAWAVSQLPADAQLRSRKGKTSRTG